MWITIAIVDKLCYSISRTDRTVYDIEYIYYYIYIFILYIFIIYYGVYNYE